MSMSTRGLTIKGKIPAGADGYLNVDIVLDLAYADEDDRQYVLAVIEYIGNYLLNGGGRATSVATNAIRDEHGRFVRTTPR